VGVQICGYATKLPSRRGAHGYVNSFIVISLKSLLVHFHFSALFLKLSGFSAFFASPIGCLRFLHVAPSVRMLSTCVRTGLSTSPEKRGIQQESQEIAENEAGDFGVVMHVAERIQNETLVLMISGRVTFYSRKVFQALVKTARFSGAKHIIFNMQEVTFMDSAALGGLVLAYLNLNEGDRDMSVVEPKYPVKSLLEDANFPSLIPTYPTEEIAFQAIQ
jgi:anti-anti-sigma factor